MSGFAAGGRDAPLPGRALVVFSGESTVISLPWLKPGFRHCFVILQEPSAEEGVQGGWLLVDARAQVTDIVRLPDWSEGRLAAWFRSRGFRVLTLRPAVPPRRCLPLAPYTCVENVKRLLGLRAPWVFTPYQLFCRLGGRESEIIGKKSLTIASGEA